MRPSVVDLPDDVQELLYAHMSARDLVVLTTTCSALRRVPFTAAQRKQQRKISAVQCVFWCMFGRGASTMKDCRKRINRHVRPVFTEPNGRYRNADGTLVRLKVLPGYSKRNGIKTVTRLITTFYIDYHGHGTSWMRCRMVRNFDAVDDRLVDRVRYTTQRYCDMFIDIDCKRCTGAPKCDVHIDLDVEEPQLLHHSAADMRRPFVREVARAIETGMASLPLFPGHALSALKAKLSTGIFGEHALCISKDVVDAMRASGAVPIM